MYVRCAFYHVKTITSTFYASFFLGDSEDPEEEVGTDFQIEDSFNKPIAPISDYASTSP